MDSRTTPQGTTIQYTYDVLGRLTKVSFPSRKTIEYTYDANGNKISRTDHLGTANWEYDALNRMTKYTDHNNRTIEYTYTSRSQLDTLKDPAGRVTDFDYNARGMPTSVTWDNQHTMNQNYDNVGRPTFRSFSNGVISSPPLTFKLPKSILSFAKLIPIGTYPSFLNSSA